MAVPTERTPLHLPCEFAREGLLVWQRQRRSAQGGATVSDHRGRRHCAAGAGTAGGRRRDRGELAANVLHLTDADDGALHGQMAEGADCAHGAPTADGAAEGTSAAGGTQRLLVVMVGEAEVDACGADVLGLPVTALPKAARVSSVRPRGARGQPKQHGVGPTAAAPPRHTREAHSALDRAAGAAVRARFCILLRLDRLLRRPRRGDPRRAACGGSTVAMSLGEGLGSSQASMRRSSGTGVMSGGYGCQPCEVSSMARRAPE
jgi:hypothetical protein